MRADLERRITERFGLARARWDSLRGRTILITGAGSGLGQSLSLGLGAAGAKVLLVGRRRQLLDETIALARSLDLPHENLIAAPCDLRSDSAIQAMIASLDFRIDGLVHCAALPAAEPDRARLLSTSAAQWSAMLDTNCTAAWLLAQALLPGMLARNHGRLVFLTSGAGWAGTPGYGVYNISKAALNSLTDCLAQELAQDAPSQDIQINAVDPGEFRSEMNGASEVAALAACPVVLRLLAQEPGGHSGRFLRRDGRIFAFDNPRAAIGNLYE